jgi:magnesium transporter
MKIPKHFSQIRLFSRRASRGDAPGVLRIDPEALPPRIEFFGCAADRCTTQIVTNVDDLERLVQDHTLSWINVDGLGDERVIRRLGEMFQIHPLALEDIVHVHQRAKVEEYPEHLLIVMRMAWLSEVLETEQLSLVVKDGVLITFQEKPGDSLDPVRKRLQDPRSRLRGSSVAALTHAVLDAVVDGYFPVVERVGDWIEEMETLIPSSRSPRVIGEIHDLRQELLFLRRCVWPIREMMNVLLRDQSAWFPDDVRLHLRDVYDHTVQLMDVVENSREMCADLRDFYYAVVSQRTNEVMKVLTIVATIFMPLSFIAGVYGMNFDPHVSPWNMPELHWRYGYPGALGLMAAVTIGMIWFIWRKHWLRADEEEPAE